MAGVPYLDVLDKAIIDVAAYLGYFTVIGRLYTKEINLVTKYRSSSYCYGTRVYTSNSLSIPGKVSSNYLIAEFAISYVPSDFPTPTLKLILEFCIRKYWLWGGGLSKEKFLIIDYKLVESKLRRLFRLH